MVNKQIIYVLLLKKWYLWGNITIFFFLYQYYFITIWLLGFERENKFGAAFGHLALPLPQELEHRKLGWKVLILKYDLGKSFSKEMWYKMADTKQICDYIF